jgi:quercetin dioxygenase-like cupin family protein
VPQSAQAAGIAYRSDRGSLLDLAHAVGQARAALASAMIAKLAAAAFLAILELAAGAAPEVAIMQHCLVCDQLPETLAPNGIGKRVLEGEAASLTTLRVPAGFAGDRHSHPHEQFVQVLSGSGSLRTEQGERAFGPGSVFHFPAGTWHAARFDTETVLVETNLRA